MTMLSLLDAQLAFGDLPLLDRAQLAVGDGERIGLIGRNGSGKSSLLDEPTNDLDIASPELLEHTLQDYKGTLLRVSRDRVFLDDVVTQTIAAAGGVCVEGPRPRRFGPFGATAAAFSAAGARVGPVDGHLGLTLAHAALGSPFVLVTVLSTLAGFDRNLLNAAASLGAPPWLAFRKVALPIIFPGVFSGALFAFATSFDEVVVALLLTGPGQRTLPRQMFAGINDNISLTITAAGTLLVLLACLLLVAAELLRRRLERMRLRPPA